MAGLTAGFIGLGKMGRPMALNILKRGNSTVKQGNLLTLPVGGGFLYVQPVYVQSTSSGSYPLLQKVLVAFGDKIAFEDTLDQALNEFGKERIFAAVLNRAQPNDIPYFREVYGYYERRSTRA